MKDKETIERILKIADELLFLSKQGIEESSDDEHLIFFGIVRDCAFKMKKFIQRAKTFRHKVY